LTPTIESGSKHLTQKKYQLLIAIMIKFTLISLLLATCTAQITPLLSARTIAEMLKIVRKDNRGLQPADDFCSERLDRWHTYLEPLIGVGFSCNCSDSGSGYNVNCQSDGEICRGDFCGTIQDIGNWNYELDLDEQLCVTYSAPDDLEGEQRCVSFFIGSNGTNSCEAEVNGQMCNACEYCMLEWWGDVAINCTNIPGFDIPTNCRDTTEFFTLAECVNYSAADCALNVLYDERDLEAIFGAFDVGFICNCSYSYNVDCQSEEEMCCGDICLNYQDNSSLTDEGSYEGQECVTFSAPADLVGEKRCVYYSCDTNGTCSCKAEMSGQMCSACEICEPTESEPYAYMAINCTNIPGFKDFPTDCVSSLLDAECIDNSTFTPSTTSAAHPKILPPYMATIFVAISFILW
jgi:hypothetical protein